MRDSHVHSFTEVRLLLRLLLGPGKTRFDGRRDATARPEFAADSGPHGIARFHQVFQYLVNDVLLEDPKVAVTEEVLLERFELKAAVARHVTNIENPKIRKACFWADRSQFRIVDGNFVAGKLILPCFDGGKFEVESGLGMIIGVAG